MKGSAADVTAVICTYNRAREVGRAIESVLAQSHTPSQVVVVDDGSTDGTEQVLRGFGSRIEQLRQANAGASAARNAGIARARAAWVAFLDSDDEWLEFHLADLLQTVGREGGPAWAFSTRLVRDPGGGPPWPEIPSQLGAFLDENGVAEDYFRVVASGVLSATSTLMVRRDVLAALGGFDTSLRSGEDLDLWWRIACAHPRVGISRRPSVIMAADRADSLSGLARKDSSGAFDLRYTESIERNLERATRAGRGPAFRPVAGHHLEPVVDRALERGDLAVLRRVGWKLGALLPPSRRLLLYFCLVLGGLGLDWIASARRLRRALRNAGSRAGVA